MRRRQRDPKRRLGVFTQFDRIAAGNAPTVDDDHLVRMIFEFGKNVRRHDERHTLCFQRHEEI